jgi:signal transduction histidine kinase
VADWFFVLRERFRWENGYWALVARKLVILVCAALTALHGQVAAAVVIAVLLSVVGAIGSLPLTYQGWRQPVAECLGAALLIGLFGPAGSGFVPYLFLPLVFAGVQGGLQVALAGFATSAVVLVATSVLAPAITIGSDPPGPGLTSPVYWLPLLAAAAVTAGWTRRARKVDRPLMEPAYADAHRLLSELNLVARQLSLGLDPHTLAAALVEELQGLTQGARATVLIRSAAGRFVPVVGDAPNPLTESVVLDAWVAADLVRRGRSGVTVVALPVLMGERVVAVVVLADATGSHSLGDESVQACRTAIAQAGPRLASALLFDDVRRLATVDERHRLAREIHDGIAQDMASVGYQIDDIASDATDEVAGRLYALREHLTTLVAELRLSIFDLRTGVDESVGLARTLGDYVQRVGKQSGLIVHVSTDESPHRLPLATEVELLRIVQEAVTNVRRHAGANNLWLTVVVDPPRGHVVVADDGRGLSDPGPDSMGITGMQERARRIGATLTVRNRSEAPGALVEIVLEPRRTSTRRNHSMTDARSGMLVADSPGAGRRGAA